MRVLVTAATRYGAIDAVAAVIAETLRERHLEVLRRRPEDALDLAGADAVVLGSAVHLGHWLRPALRLADRRHAALATLPVWLFSTGPAGGPSRAVGPPDDVDELVRMTGARGHRAFGRDVGEVRRWAVSIALSIGAGSGRAFSP